MFAKSFDSLESLIAFLAEDLERGADERCNCAKSVERRANLAGQRKPEPKVSPKPEPIISEIEFNNVMLMLRDFYKGVGNDLSLLNKRACATKAVSACLPPDRAAKLLALPSVVHVLWLDALEPLKG